MVKIKPIDSVLFGIIEFIQIQIMGFNTDAETCQVICTYCDSSNSGVVSKGFTLTEEEFIKWGDDNKYIEDLMLTKLNLERA